MMQAKRVKPFAVIPGAQVQEVLEGNEKHVTELVEFAYRLHGDGLTVNPPSYFLRFPDRPSARIIALPASLGGSDGVDGLKWISSFPSNVESGLPRASAVLVLNDPDTGYPFACLESSIISAARTAASAALAADVLSRSMLDRPTRVGFIGTGLIARYIHTFWSTFKHEEFYRHVYATKTELVAAIDKWVMFYNSVRRHSALGMLSPSDYEKSLRPAA